MSLFFKIAKKVLGGQARYSYENSTVRLSIESIWRVVVITNTSEKFLWLLFLE
tara:strand:+ start:148 stop:306 length:159 start_codon:yes stop_codon:yes gene_type:complete